MIEGGELATSTDDLQPAVGASDVIASPSGDLDQCDDVTDDDAFLAGFRDCRREALRFLRQRDVDVGDDLERHLAAVERTLLWRGDGVSDGGSSRPGKDDEAVDSVVSPSRQPLDGDDSALGVSLIDDDAEDVDDERVQSAATSELSENACDLLRLAQNNPRINNILNELFTLMDDDDDDDDCDCQMACDCDDMQQSSHDTVTSRDLS